MLARVIPSSGEVLPSIGLGTWSVFDVEPSEYEPRSAVLSALFGAGGTLIDSSPMYGRAEKVSGDLLVRGGFYSRAFLATKVWTSGRAQGIAQMNSSIAKMGGSRMDLMQIHNLVDWRTHLPVLREWKAAGKIRYHGVTHYARSAFDELEQILRTERVDFIQLPYSIGNREAEERLLPAALETGTAVLVMQPFQSGQLFSLVKGKKLPDWAVSELDCQSWSEYFLKFILAHPAVTCPIPATANPAHIQDNLRAGTGRLPEDPLLRRRMVEYLELG